MPNAAEQMMLDRMEAVEAMFSDVDSAEDLLTTPGDGADDVTVPVMTSLPCATVTGSVGC